MSITSSSLNFKEEKKTNKRSNNDCNIEERLITVILGSYHKFHLHGKYGRGRFPFKLMETNTCVISP